MTLVEVVVALALLVFGCSDNNCFMNTIRIAKLIERQTEVNAVSEVVKDQVAEALIQQNYPLTLLESAPTGPEWYLRPFIADAKLTPNVEKKSRILLWFILQVQKMRNIFIPLVISMRVVMIRNILILTM